MVEPRLANELDFSIVAEALDKDDPVACIAEAFEEERQRADQAWADADQLRLELGRERRLAAEAAARASIASVEADARHEASMQELQCRLRETEGRARMVQKEQLPMHSQEKLSAEVDAGRQEIARLSALLHLAATECQELRERNAKLVENQEACRFCRDRFARPSIDGLPGATNEASVASPMEFVDWSDDRMSPSQDSLHDFDRPANNTELSPERTAPRGGVRPWTASHPPERTKQTNGRAAVPYTNLERTRSEVSQHAEHLTANRPASALPATAHTTGHSSNLELQDGHRSADTKVGQSTSTCTTRASTRLSQRNSPATSAQFLGGTSARVLSTPPPDNSEARDHPGDSLDLDTELVEADLAGQREHRCSNGLEADLAGERMHSASVLPPMSPTPEVAEETPEIADEVQAMEATASKEEVQTEILSMQQPVAAKQDIEAGHPVQHSKAKVANRSLGVQGHSRRDELAEQQVEPNAEASTSLRVHEHHHEEQSTRGEDISTEQTANTAGDHEFAEAIKRINAGVNFSEVPLEEESEEAAAQTRSPLVAARRAAVAVTFESFPERRPSVSPGSPRASMSLDDIPEGLGQWHRQNSAGSVDELDLFAATMTPKDDSSIAAKTPKARRNWRLGGKMSMGAHAAVASNRLMQVLASREAKRMMQIDDPTEKYHEFESQLLARRVLLEADGSRFDEAQEILSHFSEDIKRKRYQRDQQVFQNVFRPKPPEEPPPDLRIKQRILLRPPVAKVQRSTRPFSAQGGRSLTPPPESQMVHQGTFQVAPPGVNVIEENQRPLEYTFGSIAPTHPASAIDVQPPFTSNMQLPPSAVMQPSSTVMQPVSPFNRGGNIQASPSPGVQPSSPVMQPSSPFAQPSSPFAQPSSPHAGAGSMQATPSLGVQPPSPFMQSSSPHSNKSPSQRDTPSRQGNPLSTIDASRYPSGGLLSTADARHYSAEQSMMPSLSEGFNKHSAGSKELAMGVMASDNPARNPRAYRRGNHSEDSSPKSSVRSGAAWSHDRSSRESPSKSKEALPQEDRSPKSPRSCGKQWSFNDLSREERRHLGHGHKEESTHYLVVSSDSRLAPHNQVHRQALQNTPSFNPYG